MSRRVASVDTFIVTIPRDEPYLGPLGPGETVNPLGYVVRTGNGTIYPTVDRSVVVRVTAGEGTVGWGETYVSFGARGMRLVRSTAWCRETGHAT